jgi:adenylate kinase family enzyme
MTKRILARAETSGRSDDNVEALRKRFATHREQCEWSPSPTAVRTQQNTNTAGEPVIAHLAERVINVDANGTIDQVFEYVLTKLEAATN